MMNYHSQFRSLLKEATDVEVYYESFDEKVAVPCVSYMESSNNDLYRGSTLQFSAISYMVKIWAENVEDLVSISEAIDSKLKDNGFSRTSSNEIKDGDLVQKILRYEAIGFEKK